MGKLLHYSFYYILARGGPGLLNFLAIVCYSRLLSPDDYGRYALVIAGIGLVNVIVFQWLKIVLSRYLPSEKEEPGRVMQPVLGVFLLLGLLLVIVGGGIALFWHDPVWRPLILLASVLTVAYAWMDLNLTMVSVRLDPNGYGVLVGLKSFLALLAGVGLAFFGFGAYAPLGGLLFAIIAAWLLIGLPAWRGMRPTWPEPGQLKEYGSYGLPLVVSFALGWMVTSSDRLLITWMLGNSYTGLYTVGYDLADQSIGLVLAVVNLAAYPLVVHKLEHEGEMAARQQLRANGELLMSVALVSAVGLVGMAPALVNILIGSEFREGALAVMPWMAVSAAVAGIKTFYFDVAFHLSKQSRWMVVTGALAAIANVVLNLVWIRQFGIIGAAWATLLSFALAALSSAIIGKRVFAMPPMFPILAKASMVAGMVFVGIWLTMRAGGSDLVRLMASIGAGGGLAVAGLMLLDVGGLRSSLLESIRHGKQGDVL